MEIDRNVRSARNVQRIEIHLNKRYLQSINNNIYSRNVLQVNPNWSHFILQWANVKLKDTNTFKLATKWADLKNRHESK